MAQTQPNESECLTFSTQDPISLHFSRFGLYTNKGSQYNTLKYYLKTHLNFHHHIFSINTLVQKYHKTRVESILVQPLHGPKSQVLFTEWEENSQVDSHPSPCLAPILPHHPSSWGVLQLILLTNVLEQQVPESPSFYPTVWMDHLVLIYPSVMLLGFYNPASH